MKKQKNLYKNISLFLILGSFAVIVFGTSYALLSAKLIGKRNYAVVIGNLDFSIDNESAGIRLLNAFPMNDEYGKTLNPYTFSLTNTGTIEEDYTITLVEDEEEKGQCNGCEFLKPSKLRYELKVNGVSKGAKMLTSSTRLDYGTLGVGETNNYELRIWLRESATIEEANKYYYGRIKVDATQTEKKEFAKYDAMMMARTSYDSTNYFWKYSQQITSIVFEPAINIPEGVESWDVSATANSGQVMAYAEEDGKCIVEFYNNETGNLEETEMTAYKLHIQAQDGIAANINSSYLFLDFTNLIRIEGIEYFDTSNVTDMSAMFTGCMNLLSLDASNFDTSNVTNMYNMFTGCINLLSLDISNFDTSNVTNMIAMFMGCSSLTSLDLNSFDTSKVIYMGDILVRGMFHGCSSLTSLDVSNFDTSNVTDMGGMFTGCSKLSSLNLSNFNTSNVEYMQEMFSECSNLASLNVSNFDTSNVTNMRNMFRECSNLSFLDLSSFDTSNVSDMCGMFQSCTNLVNLNLSSFNVTNVASFIYMFDSVPVNSEILVKDEAMKTWVLGIRSDLTNVQVKSA